MRPSRYAAAWEWAEYFAWTAEQSAAEEGEHAAIVAQRERWAREARNRQPDALQEEYDRSPITRYLAGAGSSAVEADDDAPSVFPHAMRGEG